MFGLFKKNSQNGSDTKAKKSKEFFLELDDTGNVKSEAPAPSAALAASAAETATPAEAPETKTKTSVKKAAKAEKAKLVATPAVAASNTRVEPQPGLTFAPNNLLPLKSNNSRRLPGPSMNSFLEMASQMKTPGK